MAEASGPTADRKRALSTFARTYWSDVAFVLLGLGIVIWVGWDAAYVRSITYSRGSDYWEHTAVLRALIEDPFRPVHPMTGSDVGSPRFSPHFLWVALLSRAFGFDPIEAIGFAAVANTLLFLAGIYVFFRTYFRSRLASLLGLVVLFGSWLDAPHFSNVYKLKVYFSVAGYPSTAALGVTLLTFTLALVVLRSERERRAALVALAFAWAYLYITHPLTAMLALVGGAVLAATEPGATLRRRLLVGATIPAGLILTLFWPYYPALRMVTGGTVQRVSKELARGDYELHHFYELGALLDIVGYALPGVLLIPYFLVRRRHLFLALTPLAMLAVFVVNAFVPLPLGHRFILLATFFFQASTVWLLLALIEPAADAPAPLRRRSVLWAARAAVGVLLAVLCVQNVEAAESRFARSVPGRKSPAVRFGEQVAKIAGPGAVVLADKVTSWSLPTFGCRVVAFHHQNPLVPDGDERNLAVRRFYSTASDAERAEILERYRVTHVVVTGRHGGADAYLETRARRHELSGKSRLYALTVRGAGSSSD